jgi:sugar phosphate isomerase/epimerase
MMTDGIPKVDSVRSVSNLQQQEQGMNRRKFLRMGTAAAAGLGFGVRGLCSNRIASEPAKDFKISLAEWSLHQALFGRTEPKMDNLDFPRAAREDYGIEAVEYVNQFFKDKAKDEKYLADLKKRCSDHGVRSVLIMCDGEGALGDADEAKRMTAVENHYRWADAAKFLGCHSIRVNAQSSGSYDEQMDRAADGLARLTEYGAKQDINVIVENHGGLSSNGAWLAGVMKKVNSPRCGTLPDFGNFGDYDRYKGVTELMPFAKGVSAKSHDFDDHGIETHTDYFKMMKIVLDAGYSGYVGIEYEGGKISESDGIRATKKLLEQVKERMKAGKL